MTGSMQLQISVLVTHLAVRYYLAPCF